MALFQVQKEFDLGANAAPFVFADDIFFVQVSTHTKHGNNPNACTLGTMMIAQAFHTATSF